MPSESFPDPCKAKEVSKVKYDLRMFTPQVFKKHKGVWPTLAVIVLPFIALPAFLTYYLPGRNELKFWKNHESAPEEYIDVMHPKNHKFKKLKPYYEPMPELNDALTYRKDYWKMRRQEDNEKMREKLSRAILDHEENYINDEHYKISN